MNTGFCFCDECDVNSKYFGNPKGWCPMNNNYISNNENVESNYFAQNFNTNKLFANHKIQCKVNDGQPEWKKWHQFGVFVNKGYLAHCGLYFDNPDSIYVTIYDTQGKTCGWRQMLRKEMLDQCSYRKHVGRIFMTYELWKKLDDINHNTYHCIFNNCRNIVLESASIMYKLKYIHDNEMRQIESFIESFAPGDIVRILAPFAVFIYNPWIGSLGFVLFPSLMSK